MKKTKSINSFCEGIKKYNHFLLATHVMPEGDAVGSLLAMDSLLRKLGKKSTIVCEDDFPERLDVLSSRRWKTLKELKRVPKFDAILTTDCPALHRIGSIGGLIKPETVLFNVDHHISNDYFGNFNYVRPHASATGEVVHDLYKKLNVPISSEDAKNIYVAISTDTGSFKYSNTTHKCHQIASELMSCGIDIEYINDRIYSQYSLNKIQLYSVLLSRFKTVSKGRIAWTELRASDLKRSGATEEDAEGFIDFLKYLKEVKIAFFMMDMPNSKGVRVSFRSKGRYDVNSVATHFGGGGHKKASGCVIHASLKESEKLILKQARKELSKRK